MIQRILGNSEMLGKVRIKNKVPLFNKILIIILLLILFVFGVGSYLFYKKGYRINLTESYPLGLYQIVNDKDISKGDMVLFCPPDNRYFKKAYARGYIEDGLCPSGYWELQKKVVGLEGDHIKIDDHVYINNIKIKNTKIFRIDPQGNNMFFMSNKNKNMIIPKGFMFVISDYNELSFDSKYFGVVPISTLIGKMKPILILTADEAKKLKSY
jgi:conjugative transfer signal peptidase TraF